LSVILATSRSTLQAVERRTTRKGSLEDENDCGVASPTDVGNARIPSFSFDDDLKSTPVVGLQPDGGYGRMRMFLRCAVSRVA